jgi:hypothetical protein
MGAHEFFNIGTGLSEKLLSIHPGHRFKGQKREIVGLLEAEVGIWGNTAGKAFYAFSVLIQHPLILTFDICLTIGKAFSILALQKWHLLSWCIELCCDVHFMLASPHQEIPLRDQRSF